MNQLEKLKCENHEENLCPHEHGQGLGNAKKPMKIDGDLGKQRFEGKL